jgi:oxygen-independent coproporphyrinogen-3 oxidase
MLNSDRLPVENCEELNSENLKLESLFLGFRTKAGIKLSEFEEKYGYDLSEDRKIVMLIEAGHLEIKNGIMQPTRTGMALADSMALL